MVNYKRLYEQVEKMLSMYQDKIVPGMRAKIEELESYLKKLESSSQALENEPLTLEELRVIAESEEYGAHIWVKELDDHDVMAAVTDCVLEYGVVAVWAYGEHKPQFTEQNYETKWVAYRNKPKEVG